MCAPTPSTFQVSWWLRAVNQLSLRAGYTRIIRRFSCRMALSPRLITLPFVVRTVVPCKYFDQPLKWELIVLVIDYLLILWVKHQFAYLISSLGAFHKYQICAATNVGQTFWQITPTDPIRNRLKYTGRNHLCHPIPPRGFGRYWC